MNTSTTLQWLRLVDDVASHVRLFKSARYKYKCPLKVGFTQNTTNKNNQNPISGWRGQTSRPRNHLLWFWGSFIKIFMPPRFFPWNPSWMSFWSNLIYVLFPICDQSILKNDNNFPGWNGGGGVSWSSLSRLRGRDPVSSGFPSPPFINLFCLSENLFVCNVIILLFRISAKCSPTWYYQKLNLAQVWSS